MLHRMNCSRASPRRIFPVHFPIISSFLSSVLQLLPFFNPQKATRRPLSFMLLLHPEGPQRYCGSLSLARLEGKVE